MFGFGKKKEAPKEASEQNENPWDASWDKKEPEKTPATAQDLIRALETGTNLYNTWRRFLESKPIETIPSSNPEVVKALAEYIRKTLSGEQKISDSYYSPYYWLITVLQDGGIALLEHADIHLFADTTVRAQLIDALAAAISSGEAYSAKKILELLAIDPDHEEKIEKAELAHAKKELANGFPHHALEKISEKKVSPTYFLEHARIGYVAALRRGSIDEATKIVLAFTIDPREQYSPEAQEATKEGLTNLVDYFHGKFPIDHLRKLGITDEDFAQKEVQEAIDRRVIKSLENRTEYMDTLSSALSLLKSVHFQSQYRSQELQSSAIKRIDHELDKGEPDCRAPQIAKLVFAGNFIYQERERQEKIKDAVLRRMNHEDLAGAIAVARAFELSPTNTAHYGLQEQFIRRLYFQHSTEIASSSILEEGIQFFNLDSRSIQSSHFKLAAMARIRHLFERKNAELEETAQTLGLSKEEIASAVIPVLTQKTQQILLVPSSEDHAPEAEALIAELREKIQRLPLSATELSPILLAIGQEALMYGKTHGNFSRTERFFALFPECSLAELQKTAQLCAEAILLQNQADTFSWLQKQPFALSPEQLAVATQEAVTKHLWRLNVADNPTEKNPLLTEQVQLLTPEQLREAKMHAVLRFLNEQSNPISTELFSFIQKNNLQEMLEKEANFLPLLKKKVSDRLAAGHFGELMRFRDNVKQEYARSILTDPEIVAQVPGAIQYRLSGKYSTIVRREHPTQELLGSLKFAEELFPFITKIDVIEAALKVAEGELLEQNQSARGTNLLKSLGAPQEVLDAFDQKCFEHAIQLLAGGYSSNALRVLKGRETFFKNESEEKKAQEAANQGFIEAVRTGKRNSVIELLTVFDITATTRHAPELHESIIGIFQALLQENNWQDAQFLANQVGLSRTSILSEIKKYILLRLNSSFNGALETILATTSNLGIGSSDLSQPELANPARKYLIEVVKQTIYTTDNIKNFCSLFGLTPDEEAKKSPELYNAVVQGIKSSLLAQSDFSDTGMLNELKTRIKLFGISRDDWEKITIESMIQKISALNENTLRSFAQTAGIEGGQIKLLMRAHKTFKEFLTADIFALYQKVAAGETKDSELKELGLTEGSEPGLIALEKILHERKHAFMTGDFDPEDLLTKPLNASLFKAMVRFENSEWGNHDNESFAATVRTFIEGQSFLRALPAEYKVSEVLRIHLAAEEDRKEMLPSAREQMTRLINALTDAVNRHQLHTRREGGLRDIAEKLKAAGDQLADKLSERLDPRHTTWERARERGGEKAVEQAIQSLRKRVDGLRTLNPRDVKHFEENLMQYAGFDEPEIDHLLRTAMFYRAFDEHLELQERARLLVTNQSLNSSDSISALIDISDHLTNRETWRKYVKTKKGALALTKILGVRALQEELKLRADAEKSSKTMPILFRPTRGLLAEFSGHIADACWASKEGSMLESHPNFITVTMEANPGGAEESIIGAFILIETNAEDGTPLLAIRGLNPRENEINKLHIPDFFNQCTAYARSLAEATGRTLAIVIDDHSGGCATNRPRLFAYLGQIKESQKLQLTKLRSAEDTTFNGYCIKDVTFLIPKPLSPESSENVPLPQAA